MHHATKGMHPRHITRTSTAERTAALHWTTRPHLLRDSHSWARIGRTDVSSVARGGAALACVLAPTWRGLRIERLHASCCSDRRCSDSGRKQTHTGATTHGEPKSHRNRPSPRPILSKQTQTQKRTRAQAAPTAKAARDELNRKAVDYNVATCCAASPHAATHRRAAARTAWRSVAPPPAAASAELFLLAFARAFACAAQTGAPHSQLRQLGLGRVGRT